MPRSEVVFISLVASAVAILSGFGTAVIAVKDVEAKALLSEQKVNTVESQIETIHRKLDSSLMNQAELKADVRFLKSNFQKAIKAD